MDTLTDNEKSALAAIDRLGTGSIWSDEISAYSSLEPASVGGVVASLVKKGIVVVENMDGREYVSLCT